MPTTFVPGKKICEELGISVEDLARRCHSGELIAYNENHQPILTPRQCKSKFKLSCNTTFMLNNEDIHGIIALNIRTKQDFKIILEPQTNEEENRTNLKNINNFTLIALNVSRQSEINRIKGVRELIINYNKKQYIVYYNKNDLRSLDIRKFRLGDNTELSKYISSIRLYKNIYLQVYKEGEFQIDFIVLPYKLLFESIQSGDKKIRQLSTSIHVEKISDKVGEKYIITHDNNKYIYITPVYHSYIHQYPILISQKYNKLSTDNNFILREHFFEQYSKDYFKENDVEMKIPLNFGTEVFTFEYEDFCKQYFCANSEEELYQKYQEYINSFLYNIITINAVFSREIKIINIKRNPMDYMDKNCRELLGKYIDDDKNLDTIRMYHYAIMPPKKTWKDIYNKFMKGREAGGQEEVIVSKRLKLFNQIAKKNGIAYIDAKKLRDMTEETRPEIIEEMVAQLKPKPEDEAGSNFEAPCDK